MERQRRVENQRGLGVSLPLTIRRSTAARALPLDIWGGQRVHAAAISFPWQGFAITVLGLVAWYQVALRTNSVWLERAWAPTLVVGLAFCVLEMTARRDRLTPRGIERRRWLFGPRVTVIPYEAIESVDVDFPYFGRWADAGDLMVVAGGSGHLFIAITQPETIAGAVEYLVETQRDE